MPDQIIGSPAPDLRDVEAGFTGLLPGDDAGFEAMSEAVVAYQRERNPVYARYCEAFPGWRMPYLPVEAFKHAPLQTCPADEVELEFESSGTGQGTPSRHGVCKAAVYRRSFTEHFRQLFGAGPYTIVAHLPHYAGRGARSSLLYMVHGLIETFGDDASGFFLEDDALLHRAIAQSGEAGTPFILFGAAFGLLDLVEQGAYVVPDGALVIETGGMKTFRRAVEREALHERLAEGFRVPRERVWSEYGMCELLSQCYTRGGALFYPPPWMRVEVVDPESPMNPVPEGSDGALAVIDLANMYSVSPLLTQDRARKTGDGFQVLGRLSGAALRGCNFLLEQLR
ncbi:MAG: hypothetical protein R2834_15185 [Rhodothermales bacterium]